MRVTLADLVRQAEKLVDGVAVEVSEEEAFARYHHELVIVAAAEWREVHPEDGDHMIWKWDDMPERNKTVLINAAKAWLEAGR